MKATILLSLQHRKLENIVTALGSQPHLRNALLLELADELMAHIAIEKTILLPCAERATGVSLREHHLTLDRARSVLRALADTLLDEEQFAVHLESMREVLQEHVDGEENDLFPALERASDDYSLGRMGDRMSIFRGAMMRPRPIVPNSTLTSGAA